MYSIPDDKSLSSYFRLRVFSTLEQTIKNQLLNVITNVYPMF